MTETTQSESMARERGESGQYVETVTLDDVLDVFDQVRGPVVTSTDVAEALDCTTESARQKLQRLYDRGEVDRRKTGRTMIYWRTHDETPETSQRERERAPGDDVKPVTADGQADTDRKAEIYSEAQAGREDAEDVLRDLDLAGSGSKYESRIETVLTFYGYLREHAGERVTKGDLRDLVEERGLDIGYASFSSLWNNWVKSNASQGRDFNTLAELPGVEMDGDDYVYRGE